MALLSDMLAFAVVPPEILEVLATFWREERFVPGELVVAEGEVGDTLYLIVEGQAEVSIRASTGPLVIAALAAGQLFGELALLDPSHRRQATVTAVTPLLVLTLSAPLLDDLLRLYPLARAVLVAHAEARVMAMFLKRVGPFATLDEQSIWSLVTKLKKESVAPGATIIRQGQQGYACFMLRSGHVEVVASDEGGPERRLATMGPAAIFGETALLTDGVRNATVRALEPCELLVLHERDLLDAMRADRRVREQILALLRLRQQSPPPSSEVWSRHLTRLLDR